MTKLILYYDKECPFCSRYADILKLRSCYDIQIQDANTHLGWKQCSENINLDDGVILQVDNTCFQGVEALDMLMKICEYRGLFFGLHKVVFSNSWIGGGVYFVLKFLRKMALFLKRLV